MIDYYNCIVQGDCIETMRNIRDNSVDMVLTDPPYGIDFQSNHRIEKHKKIVGDKNLYWLDDFVNQIYRVAKDNTAHYVFCSFHNIDLFKQAIEKKFKVKNILVWEKNNTSMGDLKADFAPKIEFIIFFQKGRRLINGKRDPNIFRFARTGNKFHPTEKPIDLLIYLLSKFSKNGDTVLDPFTGSGSTLIACKKMNRNFIGIEMDSKYVEIAENRLAQITNIC